MRYYKGLLLYALIIMPNHIHMIASAKEGFILSAILRDFKKHTSKEIVKAIEVNNTESRKHWMLWLFKNAGEKNSRNQRHQFWQQDNYPIELSDNEMKDQKLNNIHENPVRAGIVRQPDNYVFSITNDFYEKEGLIKLAIL